MDALTPSHRSRVRPGADAARGGAGVGVVRVHPDHPAYPPRLLHLHDPPEALYCRGDLRVLDRPTVAVVGSRRATGYGRRAAEALSRVAARMGWTVVSGLALGVDGAAHRGCLAGGGPTVAVLGSGPEQAAPRTHARLLDRILETGLVLSEYPPGTPPRPHHFPRRNRILAAAADRVVVVEAADRSGALITASVAAELGREVWAVPGSIFSANTAGVHGLLRDGAVPVQSMEAWAESLGAPPPGAPGARALPNAQLTLSPDLEGTARQIWQILGGEPRTLEALAEAMGAPSRVLLPTLASLELEGWVERRPGPTFHRRLA